MKYQPPTPINRAPGHSEKGSENVEKESTPGRCQDHFISSSLLPISNLSLLSAVLRSKKTCNLQELSKKVIKFHSGRRQIAEPL